MSDSDSDDEVKFFSARVPLWLVEAAGPWDDGEKKQLIVDAVKQRVYGDGIVDTEAVIEAGREQLEATIAAFERVEREFSNIPSVAESLKETRIERTHEVARANHELRKEVEAAEQTGPEDIIDEDELEELEQETIHKGHRVFPKHGGVQGVIEDGVTGEEVVALLRERNPEKPASLFRDPVATDGGGSP